MTSVLRIMAALALLAALCAAFSFATWSSHAQSSTAAEVPLPATPQPNDPPTLRSLAITIGQQEREAAARLAFQLLARMARAREEGVSPSEYLASRYREEQLTGTDAAVVQNCLLSAWSCAQGLALFTPENLTLMDEGRSPNAVRGVDRGNPVIFDTGIPPAFAMKLMVGGRNFDRSRLTLSTPRPVQPQVPARTKPPSTPFPYVVKSFDARPHERIPLDSYGLPNFDLTLDRAVPPSPRNGHVTFLLENRTAVHFRLVDTWDKQNQRMSKERFRVDGADRDVPFDIITIPGTTTRAVKLADCGHLTLYLDQNINAGVVLRIHVRLPEEMLALDTLPPERQKYYEYHPMPRIREKSVSPSGIH